MSALMWWGYLHQDGSIAVKRFFEDRDIQEADESPFVQKTTGPYEAADRLEATRLIENAFFPRDLS